MDNDDKAIAWEMSARLRGLPACLYCDRPFDNPHDAANTAPVWRTAVDVHSSRCQRCFGTFVGVIKQMNKTRE